MPCQPPDHVRIATLRSRMETAQPDGSDEVVCLLPARNAEEDLPAYLESVGRFANCVVALDDGSTDTTPEVLAASPLVKVLLTEPRRATSRGWNDGANRARLLQAAADLKPRWIVLLDADERIDQGDGRALREFLRTDALPGCAYGFQHYRMWGPDACEPRFRWIYRLFAFEPEQVLPSRRLHFNPVPVTIPRTRWIRTTIRVQHLAGMDDARLQARARKYQEADPEGRYRTEDGGLSEVPRLLVPWKPRHADLPILYVPPRRRRWPWGRKRH
jgi:glycosyltransferase involved in cell wall biosynthesis